MAFLVGQHITVDNLELDGFAGALVESRQITAHQVGEQRQHLQTGFDAGHFPVENGGQVAGQENRVAEYPLFLDQVAFVDSD